MGGGFSKKMTNDRHDDDTNPDNLPPVNQQRDCPSCRRHPSACNASARRRRLLLSPSARLARASSRSTAVLCSSFSLRSSASRSTSPSSSSASTTASASPAVATPPKSPPSVKPSPSPSSPTTRSSSTSTPRTCSSRPSSSSTAPCWSPTTVAASPRSSVVAARVLASRSPTDKGVRQASGGALRWRGGWGRYDKVQCVLRRFMVGIGKKGSESTYLLARGWVTHWHLRSLAFGGL